MRSLAFALLPGCFVALGSGVVFNEFFGFHIFPTTYLEPISRSGVATLLLLTGYVGLAMVTFGFFLGALKEFFHHHLRGALGKLGGIFFAWGIATVGLALIRHQSLNPAVQPVIGVSWGLLVLGTAFMLGFEGLQAGGMGVIEVISHILSYTRLAGILLASVVLALVANTVGRGLIQTGAVGAIVAGAFLIFVVAVFNVVLGVFEPGIQGARLIFVENFSKYYTGNGKVFRPFGSRRSHTLPAPAIARTDAATPGAASTSRG